MNQAFKNRYVFGDFCLDGAERRLLRNGTPVSLPPKILDTLLLLVENAGHLVEKDEFMKQLWPGTFVGEDALARNISILRRTLGESSDSQSFIATVPTRGYRFVSSVETVSEPEIRSHAKHPSPDSHQPGEAAAVTEGPKRGDQQQVSRATALSNVSVSPPPTATRNEANSRAWRRRIAFTALVLAAGSSAGMATFYLLSPAPVPRVIRTVQLTHSGRVDPWTKLVTDGSRIYFNERAGDHWNLAQTSLAGGDSQVIAAPFPNTVVLDISPDRTNLLIGTFEYRYARMPLWIWPVQGGAPRRIGDLVTYASAWCPNGREIIYSGEDGIYIANTDATNVRKFLSWEGQTADYLWSPDGRLLRFSASLPGNNGPMLWEVHSDGSSLRRLIPGWNNPPDECCGSWTPDGSYFLFHSQHSGSRDVWAIQEQRNWFHRPPPEPIRLTAGPTDFYDPLVSPDGHKVFVYGAGGKADWLRYDLKSRRFLPVLPGVSLLTASFSRDGAWLTYVSYPESELIRARPDGSQRLVLAPSSFHPGSPRWSPDGKHILFEGLRPDRTETLFIVSPDGGAPRELLPDGATGSDPVWSPDGQVVAFDREENSSSSGLTAMSILLYHLSTKETSRVPGSQGFLAPSWSPNGRLLAAKTEDQHSLVVYDSLTEKWTQLAQTKLLYGPPWWSSDGKCIYYQDLLAPNEPIYCLHWPSKKRETVQSFEQFLQGNASRVAFFGLGPDDSFGVVVTRNDSDIYALDVDFP
jgi:Tol biopolymer transport system component/DNA-binding winged helix-turn-helix (wHTH) protein